MKLDTKADIFQNLNGALSKYLSCCYKNTILLGAAKTKKNVHHNHVSYQNETIA